MNHNPTLTYDTNDTLHSRYSKMLQYDYWVTVTIRVNLILIHFAYYSKFTSHF